MIRPKLDVNISKQDFVDFYWLKEELVIFSKITGIDHSGGKIEIANRIIHFLETGQIIKASKKQSSVKVSKFDWNTEKLSLTTPITDNYKNTEHVRQFLTAQIGDHFKFNVMFMNWAKMNIGKTLKDAVIEWKRILALKKSKDFKTEIPRQFEYNRYIRDFLEDNPSKTRKDAISYWNLKKSIRGTNEYNRRDLELM